MQIHKEIEQGTDAWHELRRGRFTASNANAVATAGKGLETYCLEVMASMIATPEPSFSSYDMQRGNELESEAVSIYEFETGNKVETVGFISRSRHIGMSPDGLIGDDGLIEIKCPKNRVFLEHLLNLDIKGQYYWQIQQQLFVSGRDWCDLVFYNPNFQNRLIIERILKNEKDIEKLKKGLIKGLLNLRTQMKTLKQKGII